MPLRPSDPTSDHPLVNAIEEDDQAARTERVFDHALSDALDWIEVASQVALDATTHPGRPGAPGGREGDRAEGGLG